jgi:hypothetical protein
MPPPPDAVVLEPDVELDELELSLLSLPQPATTAKRSTTSTDPAVFIIGKLPSGWRTAAS